MTCRGEWIKLGLLKTKFWSSAALQEQSSEIKIKLHEAYKMRNVALLGKKLTILQTQK